MYYGPQSALIDSGFISDLIVKNSFATSELLLIEEEFRINVRNTFPVFNLKFDKFKSVREFDIDQTLIIVLIRITNPPSPAAFCFESNYYFYQHEKYNQ